MKGRGHSQPASYAVQRYHEKRPFTGQDNAPARPRLAESRRAAVDSTDSLRASRLAQIPHTVLA